MLLCEKEIKCKSKNMSLLAKYDANTSLCDAPAKRNTPHICQYVKQFYTVNSTNSPLGIACQ